MCERKESREQLSEWTRASFHRATRAAPRIDAAATRRLVRLRPATLQREFTAFLSLVHKFYKTPFLWKILWETIFVRKIFLQHASYARCARKHEFVRLFSPLGGKAPPESLRTFWRFITRSLERHFTQKISSHFLFNFPEPNLVKARRSPPSSLITAPEGSN